MGTKIAITENGVHKIGKKHFITDENHTYRKVRKAFLTKDGVHQLVISSGKVWGKWECYCNTRNYSYYEKTSYMVGNTFTDSLSASDYIYRDYSFWEYSGFSGEGSRYQVGYADGRIGDWIVGYYIVYETEVYCITSLDDANGSVTCVLVDACTKENHVEYEYHQGSDYFGTVEADEGALPEEGTLIEGSPEEWYCIVQVQDKYFYYKPTDNA